MYRNGKHSLLMYYNEQEYIIDIPYDLPNMLERYNVYKALAEIRVDELIDNFIFNKKYEGNTLEHDEEEIDI